MSAPNPALTPGQDPDTERAQRHARTLQRLAEIGMNLAEAIDVERQAPDTNASDLAIKFARIARAVRQTLALEAQLADGEQVRQDAAAARRRAEQARVLRELQAKGQMRKAQAADAAELAIMAREPDRDRNELRAEVTEWLFDERCSERFADRPLDEIIEEITALFGLTREWKAVFADRPAAPAGAPGGRAAGLDDLPDPEGPDDPDGAAPPQAPRPRAARPDAAAAKAAALRETAPGP